MNKAVFRIKHAVVRSFNAMGLDVRRYRAPKPGRASLEGGLAQLARLGLQPKTVIDVGVAAATPELYAPFPAALLLLIEPLVEYEASLQSICSSRQKTQYVLAAAGEVPGTAVLHVHPDKVGSSLLCEVEGPSIDGVPRTVPVVTLDQLCLEKNLPGPYLLKLDVQGAELQVLRGASRTLQQSDAVVLEVTLFGTMIGGPQFSDVVQFMGQMGFVVYDIFGFNYRPLDGALAQVDMIFVPERGMFRRSHAFATPEQRNMILREVQEPEGPYR